MHMYLTTTDRSKHEKYNTYEKMSLEETTLRETTWPYATEFYKDVNIKTHLRFKGHFYNAHVPDNDRPTDLPWVKRKCLHQKNGKSGFWYNSSTLHLQFHITYPNLGGNLCKACASNIFDQFKL